MCTAFETGIRKTWIGFLQDVLADNPAIERATDLLPFKFIQRDGKVIRETTGLRTCDQIPSLEFGETKP